MAKDFFNNGFQDSTITKIELYKDYLKEWLIVFLKKNKSLEAINIFDMFCGPGNDSEGKPGSPLVTLEVIQMYQYEIEESTCPINIYFNDKISDFIDQLKQKVTSTYPKFKNVNINYLNYDFLDYFPNIQYNTINCANLIFLDQFGVKYVSREIFTKLIFLERTDILFFISSSTFNRFRTEDCIVSILGLTPDEINNIPSNQIHRLVHQKYKELIPPGHQYGLAPFSLKKGPNIHGLIFGTGHMLGMEKFLRVCWDKNGITGDADFDIQGDIKINQAPTLFEEFNQNTKIKVFEERLEKEILDGTLKDDFSVYLYGLNRGFIGRHVRPVITKLKKNKLIKITKPAFTYRSLTKKNRQPQTIEIIKHGNKI